MNETLKRLLDDLNQFLFSINPFVSPSLVTAYGPSQGNISFFEGSGGSDDDDSSEDDDADEVDEDEADEVDDEDADDEDKDSDEDDDDDEPTAKELQHDLKVTKAKLRKANRESAKRRVALKDKKAKDKKDLDLQDTIDELQGKLDKQAVQLKSEKATRILKETEIEIKDVPFILVDPSDIDPSTFDNLDDAEEVSDALLEIYQQKPHFFKPVEVEQEDEEDDEDGEEEPKKKGSTKKSTKRKKGKGAKPIKFNLPSL